MTDKYRRQVQSSSRFTALEVRLMAALAYDLRQSVPDLANQFRDAHPGLRRNTAFGYYAETIVDPARPPGSGPTGRFGTVHAMLAGLPEAVAFQVELLNGRLLGLHADSYGQDTRAIDFATVPVTEIFTLDAAGRSIPYQQTAGLRAESPLRAAVKAPTSRPTAPPRVAYVDPAPKPGETRRTPAPGPAQAAPHRPPPSTALPDPVEAPLDDASLKVGIWVAIASLAVIAWVLGAPVFIAAIGAGMAGRALTSPKALPVIAEALKAWRARQTGPSGS